MFPPTAAAARSLHVKKTEGAGELSVPVEALATALSGNDPVALAQGGLRHYDAATGELLHSWPLPEVSSAFRCGTPSGTAALPCGSCSTTQRVASPSRPTSMDGVISSPWSSRKVLS